MATGTIRQVIGTVVDVEFLPEEMPDMLDALEVISDGQRVVLEVQQVVTQAPMAHLVITVLEMVEEQVEVQKTVLAALAVMAEIPEVVGVEALAEEVAQAALAALAAEER